MFILQIARENQVQCQILHQHQQMDLQLLRKIQAFRSKEEIQMNYISQLNGFYDLLYVKPLSPIAICLYSILFHINNKCNWKERFTVANMTVQGLSGMSRNQVQKARNELIQKGYIEYQKGTGNQCGTYLLVRFDTQNDTQTSTQMDTQLDTQSDTQTTHKCNTLNKQNKTNINLNLNNKSDADFSLPIGEFENQISGLSVEDQFELKSKYLSMKHSWKKEI